ncbi:hypothetical protein ACL90Y_01880 [Micrococcus luteus]
MEHAHRLGGLGAQLVAHSDQAGGLAVGLDDHDGHAGLGLRPPVAAAFVHVGSETAFILNSARLIPGRRRD